MPDKKSNKLCIISLLLMFAVPFLMFILLGGNGDISGTTAFAHMLQMPIDITCYIGAWILAVVSRAKYKNTFSLVLIIIYGILSFIALAGVIVLICTLLGLF